MTRRARPTASGLPHMHGSWLDARGRRPLGSPELGALVEHGVTGIEFTVQGFERGIDGALAEAVEAMAVRGLRDPRVIFERVSVEEVRAAADALESVYERTAGRDGYAAFELSPGARDDARTAVEEGRRLFHLVGRRNVMLQVPATAAGTAALADLVAHGIGVSVTLVTTPLAYEAVAGAHLRGVERFLAAPRNGLPVPAVVVTIPVRRFDRAADRSVDVFLAERSSRPGRDVTERLARARGRVGAAIATLACARRREIASSEEWAAIAAVAAQPPLVRTIANDDPRRAAARVAAVVEVYRVAPLDEVETGGREASRGSPIAERVEDAWATLGALVEAGISPAALGDRILAGEVAAARRSFESILARVARARDRALGRFRHARRHPSPARDAQSAASRDPGPCVSRRGP